MIYKLSLKDKPNTLLIITASFSRLNDVPIQRAGSLGTLITNIWKLKQYSRVRFILQQKQALKFYELKNGSSLADHIVSRILLSLGMG